VVTGCNTLIHRCLMEAERGSLRRASFLLKINEL